MAKATMDRTVTVTLEMTEAEARVLATILRHVGGDPKGPRGQVNSISEALRGVGVEPLWDETGEYTGGNFLRPAVLIFDDEVTAE